MRRKALIVLVSVMLLGCLSIPVFGANAAPESVLKPEYKSCGLFGLSHYEQLFFRNPDSDYLITYSIKLKDNNGSVISSDFGRRIACFYNKRMYFKTGSSYKAKSGYYGYKVFHNLADNTIWFKTGTQR